MDKVIAEMLAKNLQISKDKVVQEEYEMLLLKELYESEFGQYLIFKGGTALRLVYGSPRFSDDLDFTALKKIESKKIFDFLEKIVNKYPETSLIEVREKFFTIFGKIRVKSGILEYPFSIKIEISKRRGKWVKDKDFTDRVIRSETSVFSVLARVASLEKILGEKKDALKNREAARDIFDYWFINQLLAKEVKPNFAGFNKEAAKAELHRLLPKSYWRLVDSWLD